MRGGGMEYWQRRRLGAEGVRGLRAAAAYRRKSGSTGAAVRVEKRRA